MARQLTEDFTIARSLPGSFIPVIVAETSLQKSAKIIYSIMCQPVEEEKVFFVFRKRICWREGRTAENGAVLWNPGVIVVFIVEPRPPPSPCSKCQNTASRSPLLTAPPSGPPLLELTTGIHCCTAWDPLLCCLPLVSNHATWKLTSPRSRASVNGKEKLDTL